MKPFTLEWWLSRLVSAELDLEYVSSLVPDRETVKNHRELADWIRKRIINKYGEQELNA